MRLYKKYFSVLVATALLVGLSPIPANADTNGELMFILDASSSMLINDGSGTRIQRAKQSLSSSLDTIPDGVSVGLRAYGHTVPDTDKENGCRDTALLNGPAANNIAEIKKSVSGIQAKGYTPIAASLSAVENDFKGEGPKSVILISDGIDTCAPPDPCDIAEELAAKGLDIKINTLGLVVDSAARSQLQCISGATGGDYFDVSDVDRLNDVVAAVTAREANLFSAEGTPIQGDPGFEDAPLLLPDTTYTDDITDAEELYYGLELLPQQRYRFTVRTEAVGSNVYRAGTAIALRFFDAQSGEEIFSGSTVVQIVTGRGSETLVMEGEAPEDLREPAVFAARVDFRARGVTTPQPYELSYTTEGGVLPENESPDEQNNEANKSDSDTNAVPAFVWPLIGGLVVILLGAGVAVYLLLRKNRKLQQAAKQPEAIAAKDGDTLTDTNAITPDQTPKE